MVEQEYDLDAIFKSLSDPTRRDIIKRVSRGSMSVGTIAGNYDFSFAGIAKHLDVLERAGLITKTRQGKEQIVSIDADALAAADGFLNDYRQLWEKRLESLADFMTSTK